MKSLTSKNGNLIDNLLRVQARLDTQIGKNAYFGERYEDDIQESFMTITKLREKLSEKDDIIKDQEEDIQNLTKLKTINTNEEDIKKWKRREEEAQMDAAKHLRDKNDAIAKLREFTLASQTTIDTYKERIIEVEKQNEELYDRLHETKETAFGACKKR